MSDERERMLAELDRREQFLKGVFESVRKDVRLGRYDDTHACREWLAQWCVGVGVNLCAGEFQIADSIGINTDPKALATDHWAFADRFAPELPPLDYVVTNYLECFPDPLRLLMDWHARMRKGGVLAVVARNSALYEQAMGPLENHRRSSCFSINTLCMYLERAGFSVFEIETHEKEIRVAAHRR